MMSTAIVVRMTQRRVAPTGEFRRLPKFRDGSIDPKRYLGPGAAPNAESSITDIGRKRPEAGFWLEHSKSQW